MARIVSRLFAPEVGAAAFRLKQFALALDRAGYRVQILTTRPPVNSGQIDDAGLDVRRWPVLRDRQHNVRGYVQYLSFDVPLAFRSLFKRPDIYIVEPPPTTGLVIHIVSALQRRPYVWYAADIWSDGAQSAGVSRPVVAVLRAIEVHVLRHARALLSASSAITDRLVELGIDASKIITVGNGVDTDVFRPGDTSQVSPEPYFVYTGTMSEWQGAGVFIEALQLHLERGGRARIVFLGQGSEQADLKRLAERITPGAVDFLGVVPPESAAQWLRGAIAALVSIQPGRGYDFAKPTKIYAATACGTPVIFAGQGASADMVSDAQLGWAVDHTPVAVAEAFDNACAVDAPGRPASADLVEWTRSNASLSAVAGDAVGSLSHVLQEPL